MSNFFEDVHSQINTATGIRIPVSIPRTGIIVSTFMGLGINVTQTYQFHVKYRLHLSVLFFFITKVFVGAGGNRTRGH